MRLWLLEIEVRLEANTPCELKYRHRTRRVAYLLDRWRYGGRWWHGEGCRDYYLLELEGGLVAEVYREGSLWVLSRTAD